MNIGDVLKKFQESLDEPAVRWTIYILASVIMIFTPDRIDNIIKEIVALLGIQSLINKK